MFIGYVVAKDDDEKDFIEKVEQSNIEDASIEKIFTIVSNQYVNENKATIRERGVYVVAIDATSNENDNTCTLLVAPEMFCKHHMSSGFWDYYFSRLKISIAVIATVSLINSIKGLMKSDPKLITSKFDKGLIIFSAIASVFDFGFDVNACIMDPWSREGFRAMYIIASFGTIIVVYSYRIANRNHVDSEFGDNAYLEE